MSVRDDYEATIRRHSRDEHPSRATGDRYPVNPEPVRPCRRCRQHLPSRLYRVDGGESEDSPNLQLPFAGHVLEK